MKVKGKIFTTLVIIISLGALTVNLLARKQGAELIIQKTDGQKIQGELIAVKESSLLVMESVSLNDLAIEIRDIKVMTVVKRSQFWKGAGGGFLLGSLGAMMLTGFINAPWMREMPGGVISYGAMGGTLGAIVGGLIGKASGKEKTIQIEGKSDSEIEHILEELRSKARVPDIE